MKDALLLLGVFVAALAVGGTVYWYADMQTPAAVVESTVKVPFQELAHGTQSKETRRANYLITSTYELNQLWKMIDAKGVAPTVDFSRDVVVAVFAGTQPTLGYSIAISSVEDSDNRMITVTLLKPGASCLAGETATSPYQVVKMQKTELPFAHSDALVTQSCLN